MKLFYINLFIITLLLTSCTNFKVKEYSKDKQENMVYNVMSFDSESESKVLAGKAIDYYYKYLHRKKCIEENFKDNKINYNSPRYRDYSQCLAELK